MAAVNIEYGWVGLEQQASRVPGYQVQKSQANIEGLEGKVLLLFARMERAQDENSPVLHLAQHCSYLPYQYYLGLQWHSRWTLCKDDSKPITPQARNKELKRKAREKKWGFLVLMSGREGLYYLPRYLGTWVPVCTFPKLREYQSTYVSEHTAVDPNWSAREVPCAIKCPLVPGLFLVKIEPGPDRSSDMEE